MPYLTDLATIARKTGFPVTVVQGWKERGHCTQPSVRGIVAHHTAGQTGGGDYPSLHIVRDGYQGLPGPLSHFGLGRSGRIYVIAAGLCYHNAPSTSPNHTNSNSIGIEAENDGSQPWPDAQVEAYHRLCAQLCAAYNIPVSEVRGHKEVNTAKGDPHSINMDQFRRQVERYLQGDEVPDHVRYKGRDLELVVPPGEWRYVPFTHRNGTPVEGEGGLDYSVLFGPAYYSATVGVRFASQAGETSDGSQYAPLEEGTEVQLRAVEVDKDDDGQWRVVDPGPIGSPVHVSGGGHFTHAWNGNAQGSERLRFRLTHFGDKPALVNFSDASILSWSY